jgi:hypothetical protein
VIRLRTSLPGASIEERGELAAALAATGAFRAAAHELDWLAEQVGGPVGDQYMQRAAHLRARLN